MLNYIIKRLLYAIPILLGTNIIIFFLFFVLNSPDDMARLHLNAKVENQAQINTWKKQKGYDKPLFFNKSEQGLATLGETIFFQESYKLFSFNFGFSDSGENITEQIKIRAVPSLALAIPIFILGLILNIVIALLTVIFYRTKFDTSVLIIAVILMSISGLFYIIGGQQLFSIFLRWVPIAGFSEGINLYKFLILPTVIGSISGLGAGVRWYRTIFLEEINKDFVRTAKAKGLSDMRVLFKHVLVNGMLPILTGVIVVIPSLFMGSILLESFFTIPGLGSYTLEAIHSQDFAIVRSMVFIGTCLYILGLILTDISYSVFDPRVKLS